MPILWTGGSKDTTIRVNLRAIPCKRGQKQTKWNWKTHLSLSLINGWLGRSLLWVRVLPSLSFSAAAVEWHLLAWEGLVKDDSWLEWTWVFNCIVQMRLLLFPICFLLWSQQRLADLSHCAAFCFSKPFPLQTEIRGKKSVKNALLN